jgi:hypothetical protein
MNVAECEVESCGWCNQTHNIAYDIPVEKVVQFWPSPTRLVPQTTTVL